MVLELHYTAPQSVTDALASLGRTEDVRFSPSNRRLAVASFHRNPSHEVLPIAQWPADRTTLLNGPGSVAVTRVEERGPAAETPRHPGWREREPGTTVDC